MNRNTGSFWLTIIALSTTVAVSTTPLKAGEELTDALPLGRPGLTESRTSSQVAPGVVYTRIVRGEQSQFDFYTVDVAFRATLAEAQAIFQSLRSMGFLARIDPVVRQPEDSPNSVPQGFLVRSGAFATQSEATTLRDQLAAGGYTGLRVVYTGEDGTLTTGPWVVNVLEVEPTQFAGTLAPTLGTQIVPVNERLSEIAARTNALAAINGGYFVIGANDGTPGDLAGISVIGGSLVSEAVNGRTSLLLPTRTGRGGYIAALTTALTATASDGAVRTVNGLNRKPGLIRGCGGASGSVPTTLPKHDFTCTNPDEVILFTPDFGPTAEPGAGVEAVLNVANQVVELRTTRGGSIPTNGTLLSGTGEGADWLVAHAQPGTNVRVAQRVYANGQPIALLGTLGVVNGGPRLLRNGQVDIPAFAEGFDYPENPEFYYRFGGRRNPRTLAGVAANGRLILVTVDGRLPGTSVGASFLESARIMRSLGALNAVNLDGGGSTTMTVGTQVVNRPSDASGERPIGDAIVIQATSP